MYSKPWSKKIITGVENSNRKEAIHKELMTGRGRVVNKVI